MKNQKWIIRPPNTKLSQSTNFYSHHTLPESGACPGAGSEGSGPTPAPAHGHFYTYVLNNTDVVVTIIYSQKYVLFEIMYTQISWNAKLNN